MSRKVHIGLLLALLVVTFAAPARAQLLRKNDYGVGVTLAIYQFDDARSKEFPAVAPLKLTASTPEEEIDHITRMFGVEELKFRHVRTIGLREGEAFTDSQVMNDKPLTYTLTPRLISKAEVSFDLRVTYGDQVVLEQKGVTTGSYETVMLRGARGGFGVREFKGPDGTERIPEKRALLITVTPMVQTARSLQNRPSDISRPTDEFGGRVELGESDTFTLPAVANRAPLKFPPGAAPKGSITLEGIVTPEGRITNVRVLDTPDSALNPKAIEAFRQYRFNPAKLNGRPTYATYRETIVLGKQGPL